MEKNNQARGTRSACGSVVGDVVVGGGAQGTPLTKKRKLEGQAIQKIPDVHKNLCGKSLIPMVFMVVERKKQAEFLTREK